MIRFWLFGPIELRHADGSSVGSVLAQPKRLAVLARLAAVSPAGLLRRDSLIGLLWPELEEARARHALSKAIHFLRTSLGENALIVRGDGEVGLHPEQVWSDVGAYSLAIAQGRWEEAMELRRRGDLLEGFHISDAPAFERWIESERIRIRQDSRRAAAALVETAEAAGALGEAVAWARRTLDLDPFDEPAVRKLMSLLDRAGDRPGAVTTFEEFSARLLKELDLQPGAETALLLDRIRSRELPVSIPAGPSVVNERALGIEGSDAGRPPPSPAGEAPEGTRIRDLHPLPDRRLVRHRRRAALTAGLITAAVVLATFWPRAPEFRPGEGRMLVTTLENRTGLSELDVVGEMAADWLARGLQQSGLVMVVDPLSGSTMSRGAARAGVGGWDRARAAAEGSNVRYVAWGSYYRQGDSLFFQTQVSDLAMGEIVLTLEPVVSHRDQPVTGVGRLQERFLGVLAGQRDPVLQQVMGPGQTPPNFAAYQAFIEGREAFLQPGGRQVAYQRFMDAFRADTTFYTALAWAAWADQGAAGNTNRPGRDSIVDYLSSRRERLDVLDRYALDYFAASQRRDFWALSEAAQGAARIATGSPWSHNAAMFALRQNRPAEAVRFTEELDWANGWVGTWRPAWSIRASATHLLGAYESEVEVVRGYRSIAPDDSDFLLEELRVLAALGRVEELNRRVGELLESVNPESDGTDCYLWAARRELLAHGHDPAGAPFLDPNHVLERLKYPMGFCRARLLYDAGRWSEARAILDSLAAIEDPPPGRINLWDLRGRIAAASGDREGAEEAILRLSELDRGWLPWARIGRAAIFALLGDSLQAVETLRPLEAGSGGEAFINIHYNTEFLPLRGYPPFDEFIRPRG